MMNAIQASIAWGCSRSSVLKACRQGRVPGAQLVKKPGLWYSEWCIPDGTPKPGSVKPRPKAYRRKGESPRGTEEKPVTRNDLEKAAFIWEKQGSMTIGQLAKDLEISCRRVVELYEEGFRRFQNTGGCA